MERLRFYRRNFAEWQELGLDEDSIIADPLFVDPDRRDFQLQADSPAFELGFQPINVQEVGLYGDPEWVREASHSRCAVTPLPKEPEPPQPLTVSDDFEETPIGQSPAQAAISGAEQGGSIAVSAERAAAGQRSLKITDSKSLQPTWQPHFYYQPHLTTGRVRQSFDVWLEPNNQFFTEWRDNAEYPKNVGPSVQFDGKGQISVGGKVLAIVPTQRWVRVTLEAEVGKAAPRNFRLTITPRGKDTHVFDGLPFSGSDFAQLHWLGFSSTATADTAFFLDNLQIERIGANSEAPAEAK